jgi:hypothetical protein
MQRYIRYRRKTGLGTDGLDPPLLTPSGVRQDKLAKNRRCESFTG